MHSATIPPHMANVTTASAGFPASRASAERKLIPAKSVTTTTMQIESMLATFPPPAHKKAKRNQRAAPVTSVSPLITARTM